MMQKNIHSEKVEGVALHISAASKLILLAIPYSCRASFFIASKLFFRTGNLFNARLYLQLRSNTTIHQIVTFFLMNFMLNFKHNRMNPKHYGLSLRDLRNSIVAKFEE